MSEPIVTDEIETVSDTTTTEKVAIGIAAVSAVAFGVIYYRARRKLKEMEAWRASFESTIETEDPAPVN